jgi:hypothetical protein
MKPFSVGFLSSTLALSLAAAIAGCSSSGDDDDAGFGQGGVKVGQGGSGNGTSTGTGGSSSTNGGTSSAKGGTTGSGNGTSTGGSSSSSKGGSTGNGGKAAACEGVPYHETSSAAGAGSEDACVFQFEQEAVSIPVDMFIMMDHSSSMLTEVPNTNPVITRWDAFTTAMQQFIDEASKEDLRAGINFFGASRFGGDDDVDCNVDNYANFKVEAAQVADNGADLLQSINDNQPSGYTPTLPALQGAVRHAKDWVASGKNEGRAVVVVLVTDGFPTQCQPAHGDQMISIPEIAAVAQDGWDTAKIRTYVLGLAGDFNLNAIARAGGTDTATLIDEGEPTSSLVDALLSITDKKVSCNYDLPKPDDDTVVDKDKIQVLFTPNVGEKIEIPRIDSSSLCDKAANGGWFYDNPSDPKSIALCPCSCSRVSKAGRLNVTVGCAPTFGIR